jgi:hypothetical protein
MVGPAIFKFLVELVLGKWVNVFRWRGIPLGVGTYRVIVVDEQPGDTIQWRRWGVGPMPYASGTFSGGETFRVYPGELILNVDMKASRPNMKVSIEPVE